MAVYYPNPYRDPIYRGAVVRTWEETYGPLQTDKFATVWDEDEGRFLHLLVSFSANGGDSGDASVDATATIRQRWEALPEAERAVPPRPEPRLSRGWDHRKSFGKIRVHQDRCEDLTVPAALREACTVWQQERAESSLIRAAARVLFDVSHYVRGDWIARDEARARADEASRRRAKVLMRALKPFDAAKLCDRHCLTYAGYAARGIASKGPELDGQILDATEPGKLLKMPLWGFALDASVAEHYGGRFQFRLVGPFLGVPAWHCSGIKGFETEIIGGGVYAVEDRREEGAVTVVTLRQTGAYRPFDVQA